MSYLWMTALIKEWCSVSTLFDFIMSFRVRSLLWLMLWPLFSQPNKELVYVEGNTCWLFEAAFLSQPLNFRGTLRGQLGPRIWALLLIFLLNLLSCVYTFITVSGVELNHLGIKWFSVAYSCTAGWVSCLSFDTMGFTNHSSSFL